MLKSLLAVPRRPRVSHVSWIVTSEAGTKQHLRALVALGVAA